MSGWRPPHHRPCVQWVNEMDIADGPKRRARAAAEAAEWAIRLQSGMSAAERGAFIDWWRESPLHVAEMLRVAKIEAALAEYTRWDEHAPTAPMSIDASNVVPLNNCQSVAKRAQASAGRKSFRYAVMLAASLSVIVLGVLFARGFFATSVVSTQAFERREITLADGSVIYIAPESTLHIHITAKERSVKLDRGEALFHVAKDKSRPFVVSADDTQVKAIGTAFDVQRSKSDTVITVAEGRVAITRREPDSSGANTPPVISLGADEQLTVSATGVVGPKRTVDGQTVFAWADNRLIFEDSSVADVVRRFNARNRVQIRIVDPSLAARPVSGVFNASDPQSFVAFLEAAAGATAVRLGPQEILVGIRSENNATDTAH